MLAAVLSAIIGAVSVASSNKQNKENTQELLGQEQAYSSEQATLANERQLENYWQTMSPESRVQQIKNAGLSVGLMYGGQGNGGVNTAPMAATPTTNAPVINPVMSTGLNDMFENIKKMAEKENISEDTEKKKQEIENLKSTIEVNNAEIEKIARENGLTEVLTNNSKLDGILKQIEIEVNEATKQGRIDTVATQLDNMRKEGEKLLEEINGLTIDNDNKQKMYTATINKIAAETTLIYKQAIKADAETFLVKAQQTLVNEQTKTTYVERQKTWKDIENYETIMAKIEAETKLINAQTEVSQAEKVNIKMDRVTKVIGWLQQISSLQNDINNRFTNTVKTVGSVMY